MVIPVEIKSGKVGRLRSLHVFMDRVDHNYAVRFYAGKFNIHKAKTSGGKEFILMNIPYYLGAFIYDYLKYFTEKY